MRHAPADIALPLAVLSIAHVFRTVPHEAFDGRFGGLYMKLQREYAISVGKTLVETGRTLRDVHRSGRNIKVCQVLSMGSATGRISSGD